MVIGYTTGTIVKNNLAQSALNYLKMTTNDLAREWYSFEAISTARSKVMSQNVSIEEELFRSQRHPFH